MSQKKKPISKQKIFIEKKPQTIFLLFVVLILVVINFFYWEIILRLFGWGSIIVISYSLVSLFIILFQNKKFTKIYNLSKYFMPDSPKYYFKTKTINIIEIKQLFNKLNIKLLIHKSYDFNRNIYLVNTSTEN